MWKNMLEMNKILILTFATLFSSFNYNNGVKAQRFGCDFESYCDNIYFDTVWSITGWLEIVVVLKYFKNYFFFT